MSNPGSEEQIFPGIMAVDRRVSSGKGISYRIRFVDRRTAPDRRTSKRSMIALPVEIEVLYPFRKPASKIKGETADISNKGLAVALEESVPSDVVVNLRIHLSSRYAIVAAKAHVVWSGFSLGGDKFRCGLRFLGLSNDYSMVKSGSKWMLKRNKENKGKRDESRIRQARFRDTGRILRIEREAWPEGLRATREMLHSRLKTFPEGFLCAEANGEIQGFVVTEILNYDIRKSSLSWQEATDNGYITRTHNPDGDTLYGVSLSVSPCARKGVAVALLEAAGKLVIKYGLKQAVFGSRIPRYHRHAFKMSVEEYIKSRTVSRRPLDPELGIYQSVGLKPVKIIPGYIDDPQSLDYGILVVWENPFLDLTRLFPFWAQLLSSSFKVARRYSGEQLDRVDC